MVCKPHKTHSGRSTQLVFCLFVCLLLFFVFMVFLDFFFFFFFGFPFFFFFFFFCLPFWSFKVPFFEVCCPFIIAYIIITFYSLFDFVEFVSLDNVYSLTHDYARIWSCFLLMLTMFVKVIVCACNFDITFKGPMGTY